MGMGLITGSNRNGNENVDQSTFLNPTLDPGMEDSQFCRHQVINLYPQIISAVHNVKIMPHKKSM